MRASFPRARPPPGMQRKGSLPKEHPCCRPPSTSCLSPGGYCPLRSPFLARQNYCPGLIRSTSTTGVRSTGLRTRARSSAGRLAPPNLAIIASTSRGAGWRPSAMRTFGRFGSNGWIFSHWRRSRTDRLGASILPLALRFLSIAVGRTEPWQHQRVVLSLATVSSQKALRTP